MPTYRQPRPKPCLTDHAKLKREIELRRWEGIPRKSWHARTVVDGMRFSLGYYETWEEAKRVEDEFRRKFRENEPWRRVDWAGAVEEILKEA